MMWALAYLYLSGSLLALCYADAVGGPLASLGSILLIVAWPIIIPVLWLSALWSELRK